MLTASDKQTTAPSILRDVNLAKNMICKNNVENLFHSYSPLGKLFQTGTVPVARYSHPSLRLSICCTQIVSTNHPIKIKHFHMLCTRCI